MADDFLSRTVDRVFDMKKSTFYFILIFILGFVLRLIAANNLGVGADDMHFVTVPINFISAEKLVTYDQSSGLWHAFTNVIYNVFGMTQLTSRIAALLFGSFSVFVIYLLSREFFDEKISLISAFLLAIAPFHIKSTIAEMDVMAMFFALLGIYLFVKALKSDRSMHFGLAGLFLGLAIYTKVYPLFFVFSMVLYFIFYNYKKKKKLMSKNNLKKLLIFLSIAFIFVIPTLTHNYLLYKDKGFLDLVMTRTTGIGKDVSAQYYSWDSAFNSANSWSGLIFGDVVHDPAGRPLLFVSSNFVKMYDPISFYFGILGFLLVLFYFKKHRDYLWFFLLTSVPLLLFLSSSILLPKHYLFLELFLIPLAALTIKEGSSILSKITKKNGLIIFVVFLLIFTFIFLGYPKNGAHVYGGSNIAKMIEFKDSNIPEGALIVADSRIYRGRINWISQGRPYLEGSEFLTLINKQEEIPGDSVDVDVYYYECVTDDCGWGTVKNQPEFNASMESLTSLFSQNGQLLKTISEPNPDVSFFPLGSEKNIREYIRVYSLKLTLKNSILIYANQPKTWFLYPIGYEPVEENFDYYEIHNPLDKLLKELATWIVLLSVILAFLSPLYVIYALREN